VDVHELESRQLVGVRKIAMQKVGVQDMDSVEFVRLNARSDSTAYHAGLPHLKFAASFVLPLPL
jgi:hypothetical protein